MPAPLIASALKVIGPLLARNGLDVLAGIFTGKPGKRVDEVAALIEKETGIDIGRAAETSGLTEGELEKLKDFELQNQDLLLKHAEVMESLALEGEKARLADVANARTMQIAAMTSNDRFVRRFVPLYAVALTIIAFTYIFLITFGPEYVWSGPRRDMVNTILGFLLGTTLSTVIGFFFGSSQGSARKSDQIAQLTSQHEEKN